MATLTDVGGRFRYSIERFDGGLNTKDSPSKIGPTESPDCLNVVFDDAGSVWTRDGTAKYNTTAVGTFTVDHGISYNTTQIIWANGKMYRSSGPTGTTFTAITSSSGKFVAGAKVAAQIYQSILFCSDGTNGPWKYSGGESFYNMGIDIPSAPTGASIGAGSLSTGTYYYGVSFVNTQVVEGEIGSSSAGIAITSSGTIRVNSIPVGSSLAGVNQRFIYRADNASGPFKKIAALNDNTTVTYDDTIPNGSEGKFPIEDGTKPTAFTTLELHKERLFFDDATNRSFLRYTNFLNPYISEAENFEPLNNGDGESILAIAGQDDFVNAWKSNKCFSLLIQDPSDDLTWIKKEVPANLGIIGPEAFDKIQNGIVFVGRQNNRLTGLHFINGLKVIDADDGKLRSLSISEKVEYDFLNLIEPTYWANITCKVFENRLFMSYTPTGGTVNNKIFWLDLNRVGSQGQPGSWAPWDGISAKCLYTHNGNLLCGDSTATGFVRTFNAGAYSDSGVAINSYFWTKEIGGEEDGSLDGYIKDLREVYVWHAKLGNYNMNVRYRVDGDTGDGTPYTINLNGTGSTWGSMIWGVGPWGGTRTDFETRINIGRVIGRRFQIRFDNQNTVSQAFKVHRLELGMNLRRRR